MDLPYSIVSRQARALRHGTRKELATMKAINISSSFVWEHSPKMFAIFLFAGCVSVAMPQVRSNAALVNSSDASIFARPKTVALDKQAIQRSAPSVIARKEPPGLRQGFERSLAFVVNKGQWDSHVRFQLKQSVGTIWLTNNRVIFDELRVEKTKYRDPTNQSQQSISDTPSKENIVRTQTDTPSAFNSLFSSRNPQGKNVKHERFIFEERFLGARKDPELIPIGLQPGAYNYLVGNNPDNWHRDIHAYEAIIYRNLWKGIDLKAVVKGGDIEQEFVVHPGTNLNQVRVAYRGIKSLELAKDGSLLVHTVLGDLRESRPTIYQEIAGKQVFIDGRFALLSKTSYTFTTVKYNAHYPLIVDPTLLYSTFLGGSAGFSCGPFSCGSNESAQGVAVDVAGNAYVTGFTASSDFPTTPGVLKEAPSTNGAFVTKFSPLGDRLIYSTYIAGNRTSGSVGNAIAVDPSGNAYIAGTAGNQGFPTTSQAFQPSYPNNGCGSVAFVAKLNSDGTQLLYSSFLSSGCDRAHAIAVDVSGKAYIAGDANPGFPTTSNAFQRTFAGGDNDSARGDAFFAVFDPSASGTASLLYSTYLGGADADSASALTVDAFGMAYIVGFTVSNNFPVTPSAFQSRLAGRENGFVAKINPNGSGATSLIYSTYLGGSNNDIGASIAVDSSGNAYITGATASPDFPVTPRAFQTSSKNPGATFVTKLNSTGSSLVYSTLLGGSSGGDAPGGIALDSSGNSYVVGIARSFDFPTTPNAVQPHTGGGWDAFLVKLNSSGTELVYSSYLGGSGLDQATGVVVDSNGDAYVTGFTESPDFPVTPFAFQPVINQGTPFPADAFLTKVALGHLGELTISGSLPSVGGNAGTVMVTVVGSGFQSDTNLKLSCDGQPDLVGSNISVSPDGRTLTAALKLTETSPGLCHIVITNSDGRTITDPSPFTVELGGSRALWMDIVGPQQMRAGGSQNYYLVYGNTGSIDAVQIVLSVMIDSVLSLQLRSDQNPILIYQDPITRKTLVQFSAPAVAPNGSGVVVFSVSAPPLGTDAALPFQLSGWISWVNHD
jgi:hypothetical protein